MSNGRKKDGVAFKIPSVEAMAPPPVNYSFGRYGPGPVVPSEEECLAICKAFDMPAHILRHSQTVARVASCLASRAVQAGLDVDEQAVRASALLHDLAKGYTIQYGGHHSQLGGAWVQDLTHNPQIAQGVIHHVYWPFEVDPRRYFLPLAVGYADKRVRHDVIVTLTERFEDLFVRYGATGDIRARIQGTLDQARILEKKLSEALEVDLHACAFDCGGLVGGA
ncbi:MAG: hypothetical protein PWQ57_1033 [Desulfovibrionales bacterium]|jgi:putative nucleotidyltransferase with HDIG domain|nr:hypothetical protein [Desulfovibrionales bacterium]